MGRIAEIYARVCENECGDAIALGDRVPFNIGGLEAALNSKLPELKVQKFRNQIGLEAEKTEAGEGEKKILPCTSLGGVQKIGQHHPLWAG